MTTYGYIRVSTAMQGESGLGLEAQRDAILHAHPDAEIVVEVASAGHGKKRPILADLLERLDAEPGSRLVVAKLDRLARSTVDFGNILARAARRGWKLVLLDLNVDTGSPSGVLVATVVAAVAQFERDLIAQRTSAAVTAKRNRGERVGSPSRLTRECVNVMLSYRDEGRSYAEIAEILNLPGYQHCASPSGRPWTKSSVAGALKRVNVG